MSRVTLWMTVTMCLDVSCLTSRPEMYSDMVGDGVPMAMHNTVMLLPSMTRFIGWTVGGCTGTRKNPINAETTIANENVTGTVGLGHLTFSAYCYGLWWAGAQRTVTYGYDMGY